MGRDENGQSVFVPYTIPGEKARVKLTTQKKSFSRGELLELLTTSPDRVVPPCPHFTICGGCHFQHMSYEAQLRAKREVVEDQLSRIGGFKNVTIRPTFANPTPWEYRIDISLSPTLEGKLGFWSPALQQVIPIETCHIIHPQLLALWHDIDLELPGLRKLTLRVGDEENLLAAFEIDDIEPPELLIDFPVSVAIVLPDKSAASLIGDPFLIQTLNGNRFRVSPGCYFPPSSAAALLLVESVMAYAGLTGKESVIDAYCGVGTLTAFLANAASQVIGIEINPDAIEDATINLDEKDNGILYQGKVEEIIPLLDMIPDVMVLNPPSQGLSPDAIKAITANGPLRIIYVSSDVATLARDGKKLSQFGYRLIEIQPIDMAPQTFQIEIVSLWQKDRN